MGYPKGLFPTDNFNFPDSLLKVHVIGMFEENDNFVNKLGSNCVQ